MLLLTHIGENLPPYLNDFLTQFRKFNENYNVVFLTNNVNVNHEIFINHNIKTYPIEDLSTQRINDFIVKFGYGDINTINKHIVYGSPDYWCVTAVRLFYVYEYMNKMNLNKVFHFENDIMIYESLDNISKIIKDNHLYENQIAITRGTNNKIMTGFVYIDTKESLDNILNQFTVYVSDHLDFNKHNIDHLNEMALLHIYQNENPDKLINLPILPKNEVFKDFNLFNSVFDPATYGQFLDGVPSNPGVSIMPDSIIGDEMRSKNNISIGFEIVDNLRVPFITTENGKFKINSLHIHSKRLNLFLS
jgi:hypothetical protein